MSQLRDNQISSSNKINNANLQLPVKFSTQIHIRSKLCLYFWIPVLINLPLTTSVWLNFEACMTCDVTCLSNVTVEFLAVYQHIWPCADDFISHILYWYAINMQFLVHFFQNWLCTKLKLFNVWFEVFNKLKNLSFHIKGMLCDLWCAVYIYHNIFSTDKNKLSLHQLNIRLCFSFLNITFLQAWWLFVRTLCSSHKWFNLKMPYLNLWKEIFNRTEM